MDSSGRRGKERRFPRLTIKAKAIVRTESSTCAYVVENISAAGALLTGGPAQEVGSWLRIFLEVESHPLIELHAEVLRNQTLDGTIGIGVAFRHESDATEDAIQHALLKALEGRYAHGRKHVLIVSDAGYLLDGLEGAIKELSLIAITAKTPLEAIYALHDPHLAISSVLAGRSIGSSDGVSILEYVADIEPGIRRILLYPRSEISSNRGRAVEHEVIDEPLTLARLIEVLRPS